MKKKRYSISEASRLLEMGNHVLRYWEEEPVFRKNKRKI